jgi:hypothetical protein
LSTTNLLDGVFISCQKLPMMQIHDIFDALNGPARVAVILGCKTSTASEMKRRKVIPVRYWPKLVQECRVRKIKGVNYDVLVALHSKRDSAA